MSIFTAARKITAARITGACTAAGAMSYLTKEVSVICPIAGAVVVGALVAHRKLVKDNVEEVSTAGLCAAATVGAAEVAVGGAVGIAAKRYMSGRMNKTKAPEATEVVDIATPVDAVSVSA